jgi:hypothetical protein
MILETLILIILLEDVKFKNMKKLILLLLFIPLVFSCNSKSSKTISKKTEFENGRWISTTDSLAGIEIKNGKWNHFYKTVEGESTGVYDFKVKRGYLKEISAEIEYLEMIIVDSFQGSDTLKYAIVEYSTELLSLSYIGRGNTLNYIPEKKTEDISALPSVSLEDIVGLEAKSFLAINDGTAWTDGTKSIIFRSLSSIEYRESKEPLRGYIFDGFLKKSIDNIKFYNDQGYFIIIDSIVNTKNIYTISSKSAIDVRDFPNSSGNVVGKLMSGMAVNVLSETENMLTINDVDNQVGGSREMPGRWVEIETYSPLSGHRQEAFPDNNGSWFYVDKAEASRIVKDPGKFECHMCGYQAIKENTLNKLLFVREEMGDYGDGEYLKHTFSIEKKEIVEIKDYYDYDDPVSSKRIWIPINSNSVDIDRIKNRNKPKEYSQAELDSISAREIELRALQEEEMSMDDTQYYFFNDARLIEDPKSSRDFYNNGLVKFFKPSLQNYMEAIDDLNTAIEINVVQDEEELWVGPAYFYMGIAKGRLSLNGVRDDWEKAASLGFYHAKKALRENGYASLLLKE